eukprot:TRINITY_DN41431_c0_g1_i1.p3 TRINITY_DN41431_c0_g1~~TRINITY_DN41431_c0_g1_i1.p3  ORF type:complete len:108 (+),score=37.89 TRINITY_DN41431_c0_g1_i1:52-375(+)
MLRACRCVRLPEAVSVVAAAAQRRAAGVAAGAPAGPPRQPNFRGGNKMVKIPPMTLGGNKMVKIPPMTLGGTAKKKPTLSRMSPEERWALLCEHTSKSAREGVGGNQ